MRPGRTPDSTYFFFIQAKLFSASGGFIPRPTHDRLAALRQASRTFPERGTREAGRPGPPPTFFLLVLLLLQFRPGQMVVHAHETARQKIAAQITPQTHLELRREQSWVREDLVEAGDEGDLKN